MEKRDELELMKQKISELKKENRLLTIKSETYDLIHENYSNSIKIDIWVEISFKGSNNYGLVFNIESNHDLVKFETDDIEIGYIEIYEWFEKNNIEFNEINLTKCINDLIKQIF